MENNENKSICHSCGGACCRNMGCHISPRDLPEISVDYILNMLKTGNYSIDYWEGDVFEKERGQTYYLRMRNVGSNIVDPSWGGKPCVMFSPEIGCKLSWENRPRGGKALIPQKDFNCSKTTYSKKDCVIEWYEFQNILDKVVREVYSWDD